MERPALQRLLEVIGAGRIDIVVVYKVDLLTRSLADFASWSSYSAPIRSPSSIRAIP
jgi:DNA invertase Pin-like site-specific DNA recombinase